MKTLDAGTFTVYPYGSTIPPVHAALFGVSSEAAGEASAGVLVSSQDNGVSFDGGNFTLTGSGFGSKAQAAPHYFQDFSGLADDSDAEDAGLTWGGDESNPDTSSVISSDGVGGKALSCLMPGTNGGFSHLQLDLPANTLGVFVSFWIRFFNSNGGTLTSEVQWKGPRAGVSGGTPQQNYEASPKLSSQVFIDPDGEWDSGSSGYLFTDAPSFQSDIATTNDPDTFDLFGWTQRETWLKFNDVGSANGQVKEVINGTVIQDLSNLQNRVSSGQHLEYLQIFPGIDATGDGDVQFDVRLSRIYVDTTRKRVVLTDNAVYASSQKFIPQVMSAWGDTELTGELDMYDFSSGETAYFHVLDEDDSVIETFEATLP